MAEGRLMIRTSHMDWQKTTLQCFIDKRPFLIIDDSGIGFAEEDLESGLIFIKSLREKAGFSKKEIAQILTSLGMSVVGIALILIAVFDPDPTSKLGILLAGGVVLITTGGVSILKTLGHKGVKVTVTEDGIQVDF